ncbi:MAG: hypothetical protein ACE5GD_10225 [Candidatus Geothermarchaeales archaeon]
MRKTFTLLYYVPLGSTIALTPLFFILLHRGGVETPNLGVFPEGGVGPLLNAVLWVSVTAFFGLMLIFLVRKSADVLRGFIIALSIYTILAISLFYLDILFSFGVALTLSLLTASLSLYSLIKRRYTLLYSVILLTVMVGLGIIFNASFEEMTKVAVLVVYSLFDIYSVYKGMLKVMFEEREAALRLLDPLLIRFGPLALGVGDVIFYSLLLSYALETAYALFLPASISLTLGHTANLWILRQRRIIPALPLPVVLTLAVILAYRVLC